MTMNFRPGQKVVCISPTGVDSWRMINCPIKGNIYHVRGYRPGTSSALWLVELVNSPVGLDEPTFFDRRFRLVVEKKTDISIFTKLLNDANNKQELVD